MRDRAVVWAAMREFLPLVGLAVVVGGGITAFEELAAGRYGSGGLLGVPVAALWGGVALGGSSPAAMLHLATRPVDRLRLLWLRMVALWSSLLVAGIVLSVVFDLMFFRWSADPSAGWIAVATVFMTGIGAQAGMSSHREPVALGASLLMLAVTLGPLQLAIDGAGLSWDRVMAYRGAGLVCVGVCVVAAFVPVCIAWRRWWPRTGGSITLRASVLAVAITGIGVPLGAAPLLMDVAEPEHGEILAMLGEGEAGIWVATGTRREGGDDLVDGVVEMGARGRRTVVWDRRALHSGWRLETITPVPGSAALQLGLSRNEDRRHIVIERSVAEPRTSPGRNTWLDSSPRRRQHRSSVVSAEIPASFFLDGVWCSLAATPTELDCPALDEVYR